MMGIRRGLYVILLAIAGVIAILPLILSTAGIEISWLPSKVIAGLNLLGWSIVITFVIARVDQRRVLARAAQEMGVESRFQSLENLLESLIHEIRRRHQAHSLELIERRIVSKEELSRALEKTVAHAYRLLGAESAELALFDRDAGLYHSSFVMGKPFRSSAQAMLAGAAEGEQETSPDVLIHPIAFAGSVLGSLRVGLKKGRLPTTADRELLSVLALQGGLAIINAQYTHELIQMKRVSEESVKAKTGFLANLSHELRGPLGIMLNSVELVLDGLCGSITADQSETLKMVRQNGEHLLELINDVLDYAKIESGKVTPNKVDILVNDLLTDLCAVVRSQAESKRHKVICRPNEELLAISCDRRHARQMLINLLTNAIKYTPDGGTIEVWGERVAGGKIKINVKDSGVGISPTDRGRVFAAFERIEHSYSIKQVGTGLGMPLTKRLAELNGGIIDFASTAGKGTQFWLLFPAIEYDAHAAIQTQQEAPRIEGRGEVVLLLQRDEHERAMMVRGLSARGYRVVGCGNLAEAQSALRAEPVVLVLLDNDLVDVPEEGVIPALRVDQHGRNIPIVVLSSRAFVFDVERYLKAGVDRCLAKPLRFNELAQTCRELIDMRASIESAASSPQSSSEKGDTKIVKTKIMTIDDLCH